MKKQTKRVYAMAMAAVMALSTTGIIGTSNVKAAEKSDKLIYSDSNISLTVAFDRYIATGTGELAQQLQIVVSEELKAEATETDAQPDITETGNITTVDLSTTGNITEVAPEPEEVTEETSEETETALTEESEASTEQVNTETTEAPVQETTEAPKADANADYSKYAGKAIITATGVINIRSDATASSTKVGTIRTGGVLTVTSKGTEWSAITSGSVSGYIKNEFMAFDDAAGKYAAENPNYVAYDSAVPYTEPVQTTEATTQQDTQAPVVEEAPASNVITTATGGRQDICDYALQFVGNPYVWGGTSLTNGADCSGFVLSVYANFGYSLPHSSALQATRGTEVDLSAVSPGDLVFYKNGGSTIGHVALYIGNGQIVHASNSRTGIITSNMYYSTPCKAVRIAN